MKRLRITIGNKSYEVTVEDLTEPDSYQTPVGQVPPAATPAPPGAAAPPPAAQTAPPTHSAEAGAVTSPMAGLIQAVMIKPGDQVEKGQPLVILEAMKMENKIAAAFAGTVKSVDVRQGDSVQEGQVLAVLE